MIGFRMPTRVHIAPGALDRLPEAARALGLSSALLAVDPGVRSATSILDRALELLRAAGLRCEVFDAIEPNPRTTTATAAADLLRSEQLDGVIALGGGSVLDAAKAAAMLAENELRIEQYEGRDRYAAAPRPMIAVPTTCGTGSEVTWVSVLSQPATRTKISVKGESMFPDQALVDADLLMTLPADLVASTGVDALTHALEATTSAAANAVSDALAEEATRLLFTFLDRARADIGGDDEARAAVMRASTLAGLAFGNADVAAVHCLSEAIGGLADTPHGLTNAVLLAPVLRSHRPWIDDRLAQLDSAVLGGEPRASVEERADRFLAALDELLGRLEIPPFAALEVDPGDFNAIAARAVRNGSNRSNPRPMSGASYRALLDDVAPSAAKT
ncbi:MAG: iron-containing alcohol dehydrogenase [Acidobacteriota bacterium]